MKEVTQEVAYGLFVGTEIGDLEWRLSYSNLCYFTEIGTFGRQLRHSG